jgi:hypothetical protein
MDSAHWRWQSAWFIYNSARTRHKSVVIATAYKINLAEPLPFEIEETLETQYNGNGSFLLLSRCILFHGFAERASELILAMPDALISHM